jgi:hypothetical protein
MASRGGFEGDVGAVDAQLRSAAAHSRDIARSLERGAKFFVDFGREAAKAESKMSDIARKMERLNELGDKGGFNKLNKEFSKFARDATIWKGIDKLDKGFQKITDGIIKLGSGVVAGVFNFLIDSIKRVYELQERWTRAIGGFNMKIGGMTAGLKQAQRAATQWSSTIRGLTNGDIFEGIQMFEDFTLAMSRTVKAGDQMSKMGIQLARGFNLGGQGAGKLARTFEDMEMTAGNAASTMSDLIDAANLVGVPVNQLAGDVVEANTYMARFGKEGAKSFVTAAGYARKFSLSMRELQAATEKFDTFDQAAESAAKLNSTFGTLINSIDLMLMDDPAQRLEYMRQQFIAQGRTFDTLSIKERRYAAEVMGVNEQQLASLLSLSNANFSYTDLMEKQAKEQQTEMQAKRRMEIQLRKTAQTMYAFGAAFDRITVAIAKAIRPLLEVLGLARSGDKDFKSFGHVMESITVTIEHFFESLAKNDKWQMFMRNLARGVKDAGKAIGGFIMSGKAAEWAGELASYLNKAYEFGKKALSFMYDMGKRLQPVLGFVLDHVREIAMVWAGFQGLKMYAGARATIGNAFGGDRGGLRRPRWSENRVMMKQGGPGAAGFGGGGKGGINWATQEGSPFGDDGIIDMSGLRYRDSKLRGRMQAMDRAARRRAALRGGLGVGAGAGIMAGVGTAMMGGSVGESIGSGAGAMGGTALGMVLGGPVGAALGGAIGEFVGKRLGSAIQGLFGSSAKSPLQKARESLKDAMDDMRAQAERFTSINEIMQNKRNLQEARQAALSERIRQIDETAAGTKGKLNQLNTEDISGVQTRLIEMARFGMRSRELTDILAKSLAPGAQLTDKEIRKVLDASTKYEGELQKLRDVTQKQFEQEQMRLQTSRAAIEKQQLEMQSKQIEVQLNEEKKRLKDLQSGRVEQDFTYERDEEFRKFADSRAAKFKTNGFNIAYKNFSEDMKRQVMKDFAIQRQKQKVTNMELDLTETKEKAIRAGMDLDKKLFIMQARHLIMQDTRFLELQKVMAGAGINDPNQVLAAFLGRNREEFKGLYGSDFDSLVTGQVKPMAAGGIVRRPTRALIGEAGPEAVVPLRAVARMGSNASMNLGGAAGRALAQVARGSSGGGRTTPVVVQANLYMDGKAVARQLVTAAVGTPEA